MNRKQFSILIALLVVLGGTGWFVQQGKNKTATAGEQGTGQRILGESFPINDVAHIRLVQGSNEVNLVKKQDIWKVAERTDYPANFASISDFLIKIRDTKVVQQDEVGDADRRRLQLMTSGEPTNSGLLVEFKSADGKLLTSLTLGKKHMAKPTPQQQQFGMGEAGFPDGRYVQTGASQKVAYLVADPMNSIEAKPSEWLSKEFFKIERPKSVALINSNPSNSWAITRETESGEWQLLNAMGDEKLDAARASGVSSPFSSPSFEDVAPAGAEASKFGWDKGVTFKIETFDDFQFNIKVGAKTDEKYPVTMSVAANFPKERVPAKDEKPEDKTKADKAWSDRQKQLDSQLANTKRYENWVYWVPSWTVDSLLKERKEILVEKKEETKPEANVSSPKPDPFPIPPASK